MKINSVAALHTYNKINEHTSVVHHAENSIGDSERKCENTDQIQISLEGTRKVEVEQLTRAISAEMHESVAPERLEELRQAIQEKNYYVSAGDLADAMMRYWRIV